MARTVFCAKLQKDLPGLDESPWPGELGKRIYDNVSAQAWKMWEDRMKMILNEYRLMPWQKEAQQLMAKQMEDFFFGGDRCAAAGVQTQVRIGGSRLVGAGSRFGYSEPGAVQNLGRSTPTTNPERSNLEPHTERRILKLSCA